MPHNQCPPSRRGHSWRELTQADQIGPRLSRDSIAAAVKVSPALRLCKRCGAIGRVSSQGVIHVVGAP